ncbi:MerR family transcription regulator [Helicobacter cinaedi PAGU611]|uniref:MerR family transcription regulator n=1 Tax=Helicobacter cinaedi CCUG 18818 = ATCC BAA-847 TaxID=537971 RepID=A0AAI8MPK6_9HELI|nr:MerR family transcriptional regulator [Helicobacter cinaedi]EFR46044.1 transcriptional regulator, MerR family [Helicobacter cinaedi CCUG 18818 = ATCC BAA-847]QOQ90706.1 MerR family transcriptional regulator [Helicobacter cinaedi]BAM13062.1 MerR family transcription regulator [Helicobacter cinaedi PAGU611]BAM33408.1 MerR family transcription regulator [Helicobacter cinaedi CCUG 18818 = ATCC BAA-847]BBB20969.1 putative transcriptional regulator [Helicobacter cinaedi]
MAYTIIEVERATNIPSRKIRFWLDKGLFPFVERDENGVRYFAKSDIVWVEWVDCLRSCSMSIDDIKHYIKLTMGGIETAKERKELLERHFDLLNKELEILHIARKKMKMKIALYNEMIKTGIDYLNPNNTTYQWSLDSKGRAK